MPAGIDFEHVRRRLAAGEGGYEVVHTSPGLELGAFVPAGAEHRFVGYEQLSVLVIFAQPNKPD